MTRIWLVSLLELPRQRRVLIALLRQHARDVADLGRHPVVVTTNSPAPRVTFVFM